MPSTRTLTVVSPFDRAPNDRPTYPARGRYRVNDDAWSGGEIKTDCELNFHRPMNSGGTTEAFVGFCYLVAIFIVYTAFLRLMGTHVRSRVALGCIVLASVVWAFRNDNLASGFHLPSVPVQFLGRLSLGSVLFFIMQLIRILAENRWVACYIAMISVFLALVLADGIATNFIHFATAHIRLADEARERYREQMTRRFRLGHAFGQHQYWCGFLLPLVSMTIAALFTYRIYLTAPRSLASIHIGMFAVLIFTAVQTSLVVSVFISHLGTPAASPFQTAWQAIIIWIRYNHAASERPGWYQSPYGHKRRACLFVVGTVATASLLPFARYFPIYLTCCPKMDWIGVGAKSSFRTPSRALDSLSLGRHVLPSVDQQLTQTERIYRNRLREHSWRWAREYEDQRREFSQHTPYLKERQAARAFLLAAPENWVGVALSGIFKDSRFAYAVAVSVLLSVIVPIAFVASIIGGVLSTTLPLIHARIRSEYRFEHTELIYAYHRLAQSTYEVDNG